MMNLVLMPMELVLMVVFVAFNFIRETRNSDDTVPAA